jgi:membrane protease YdiL (CAAX protease family)
VGVDISLLFLAYNLKRVMKRVMKKRVKLSKSWIQLAVVLLASFITLLILLLLAGAFSWNERIITIAFPAILFILAITAIKWENLQPKPAGYLIGKALSGIAGLILIWLFTDMLSALIVFFVKGWYSAFSFYYPLPSGEWSIFSFVASWLFVGPAEELMFRGYMQNKIRSILSTTKKGIFPTMCAIGITSVIFTLFHIPVMIYRGNPAHTLFYVLLLGLLLGYMYNRSNNLVLISLMHGSINYPLPWIVGTWRFGNYFSYSAYLIILVISVVAAMEIYYRIAGRSFKY